MNNNEIPQEKKLTDGQIRYQLQRNKLIKRSQEARAMRQAKIDSALADADSDEALRWAEMRINTILKSWETQRTGAAEFNTFNGWRFNGYSVLRGSKAFIVWGRKRKANGHKDESVENIEILDFAPDASTDPNSNEYDFFPLAYMFSDLQVEKKKEPLKDDETTNESKPKKVMPFTTNSDNELVLD